MRTVFLGSPAFAVPILEALADATSVQGVVTQPDRPAGRGRSLRPPPVKQAAQRLGLPILQPGDPHVPEVLARLGEWLPDVLVVAAYGKILRPSLLEQPPFGCVNIHASLLPRWRGASPIQAAILSGDPATGVTIMRMDEGMDTGPILSQQALPILPAETGGELSFRLALLGAELLVQTLPSYVAGTLIPRSQDPAQATTTRLLTKADGEIDPGQPAEVLARQVRAFHPWPGTYLTWDGRRVSVHEARVVDAPPGPPGRVSRTPLGPLLSTSEGGLLLEVLQPAGSRPMSGPAFLRGYPGVIEVTIQPPGRRH